MNKILIDSAEYRSNIYGLFALIYSTEITSESLKSIKETNVLSALFETGVQFEDDFLNVPDKKLVEDLAVEYARLFIGPGPHISPHESIYHERSDGDWGTLWGADTVVVKKFIESTGLAYRPDFKEMPDHISVEFELMQQLTNQEAKAYQSNDCEGAIYCLNIEKKFLAEHLAKWIPVFTEKVISSAKLSFYREIAKITRDFIQLEEKEIDNYLSDVQQK